MLTICKCAWQECSSGQNQAVNWADLIAIDKVVWQFFIPVNIQQHVQSCLIHLVAHMVYLKQSWLTEQADHVCWQCTTLGAVISRSIALDDLRQGGLECYDGPTFMHTWNKHTG